MNFYLKTSLIVFIVVALLLVLIEVYKKISPSIAKAEGMQNLTPAASTWWQKTLAVIYMVGFAGGPIAAFLISGVFYFNLVLQWAEKGALQAIIVSSIVIALIIIAYTQIKHLKALWAGLKSLAFQS